MFTSDFEEFQRVYNEALDMIICLRENAMSIKEKMEEIIDSCENIEGEL